MLDISIWELLLCAVIGLLVLGPERMPEVVRKLAHWIRAARATLNAVRSEFERELEIDKLKSALQDELHPSAPPQPKPAEPTQPDIQDAIARMKAASPTPTPDTSSQDPNKGA